MLPVENVSLTSHTQKLSRARNTHRYTVSSALIATVVEEDSHQLDLFALKCYYSDLSCTYNLLYQLWLEMTDRDL